MTRPLLALVAVPLALGASVAFGASDDGGRSEADKLRAQLAKEREVRDAREARFRRAIRASHSRPEFVWWSTGDTRKVAEAVFDEQGVSAGDRAFWRCIIRRESQGEADVWYSGDHPSGGRYNGWLGGRFAGTDRVNGLMQMRPYHAETGDRVVTYRTYLRTSDPVFSVRKALRLGRGPFFASAGACS